MGPTGLSRAATSGVERGYGGTAVDVGLHHNYQLSANNQGYLWGEFVVVVKGPAAAAPAMEIIPQPQIFYYLVGNPITSPAQLLPSYPPTPPQWMNLSK